MSAASDDLGARIRTLIGLRPGIAEKKMFGGFCFLLNGNMVVGSMKSGELLARVGPDLHDDAIGRAGASVMEQGGRQMRGFILVDQDTIAEDDALADWIGYAEKFVATLPPK